MANQANNVNPLSEPLLPPIHLHITTIRPKECDISWSPPIELSQYKLGYNIQVFKEENHDDNKAMQDWSISNTTWKISNLEPKTYYAIHIHSLLKANNIWTKSEEPSIIKFWTAPTQKDAKKIIPDPPEQPKEVAMDDQRLRHPKKQKNNEIIVWKSPEKFRGKISYKISWNSDLLGVTENTYVDLGNKNRVGIKFKYMYQQKRRQYEYNEDEDDNDNNYSSHSEDDNKYDHISNKIKLTLKSQTYYKGKSSESMEKCEVKLIDIEPYNNNNNNIIKWEDIYLHDKDLEQIVIWLYLQTKSTDKWQVQPQKNEEQNIELIKINNNILNGQQSLFVTVWKKPFCRHLNNFFNIGTKQQQPQQEEKDNNNYDNLDIKPKRDPTMVAFFLRSKQRAIVIEYCKKMGFIENMFGSGDDRRENIFKAMLNTMLERIKDNDNNDDDDGIFTFHDCNASIEWIFECEWVENNLLKKQSLQSILDNVFSTELKRMLDNEWDNEQYNDKSIKKLLLIFYWLFRLFPHRFRQHWMIGIIVKLNRYIEIKNDNVFKCVNRIYGKQMISNILKCIFRFVNKKTFIIKEFLPSILWYNMLWNCGLMDDECKQPQQEEKDNNNNNNNNSNRRGEINIQILYRVHGKDMNKLKEMFNNISDKLKREKELFDNIIQLNDAFDYGNNEACIEFRDAYFKEILFKNNNYEQFLKYLKIYFIRVKKNCNLFVKLLNKYNLNITNYIQNNFNEWRNYLKYIYLHILEIEINNDNNNNNNNELTEDQINVLNAAIKPIYIVIINMCDNNEADGLQKLMLELPISYDKSNILKHILLNKKINNTNSYLLFKHGDKFMEFLINDINKNNNELEIESYLEKTFEYWYSTIDILYIINIINKYKISWNILANTLKIIIIKETNKKYLSSNKDDDEKSMKSFAAMINFLIDYNIPLKGRKALIPNLISFWRENIKNTNFYLNKLFFILFQLLFGKISEFELYDEIIKQFKNIKPYNCINNNFKQTIISSKFLEIKSNICFIIINQESFYRFNKTLCDKSNPFKHILLSSSGIYYLMGILMGRLDENKKSDEFLAKSLQLSKSKTNNNSNSTPHSIQNAFYSSDLALKCYYNNNIQNANKYIQNAINLSSENYINLINSIINGKEKKINDIIKYFDTLNNNYSYFARFTYSKWLNKHQQYDKAKKQFEIIIKQFENNEKVINGLLYYEYGKLLLNIKQNDLAKKQFIIGLKIKPCLPNIHKMCNQKLKELDDNHNINDYIYNNNNNSDSDSDSDNNNNNDDEKNSEMDDDNDDDDDNDLSVIDSQDEELHTQSSSQQIPFTGHRDGNTHTGFGN